MTIRIADLVDSSLAARRIMPAPRSLVASPDYLEQHGVPQAPDELADHAFINYGCLQSGITIQLTRGKEVRRVRTRGPVMADNGDFLVHMAEAGLGIALVPDFIAADAIAAGKLVRVLEDWSASPIAVSAVSCYACDTVRPSSDGNGVHRRTATPAATSANASGTNRFSHFIAHPVATHNMQLHARRLPPGGSGALRGQPQRQGGFG